jgi:hypothetical protein
LLTLTETGILNREPWRLINRLSFTALLLEISNSTTGRTITWTTISLDHHEIQLRLTIIQIGDGLASPKPPMSIHRRHV